jgi:predicted Zn-dependent protease
MTIPERVIILLHEVAHNFISYDQDDEVEADQHAIQLYNELGYPKIEAINAFGEIMSDTDTNYERMLNLINM